LRIRLRINNFLNVSTLVPQLTAAFKKPVIFSIELLASKSFLLPVTAAEYELLCRLTRGDRVAFDLIYHQYCNPVYCNALKITRDRSVAEDIVQEVFITLWEKKETISLERPVGGWLFVLCYNRAVNQLRKKLRESVACRHLEDPAAGDPTDEASYSQQWELLENAMAQLSPQKRKVFELCKIQGKTYEETAAVLQISKYTVKEYLSASVSFLKEQVQHHPGSSVASSTGMFLFILGY
jgi:RNA polymerase sigma-70 factor (ECF subfamily)